MRQLGHAQVLALLHLIRVIRERETRKRRDSMAALGKKDGCIRAATKT